MKATKASAYGALGDFRAWVCGIFCLAAGFFPLVDRASAQTYTNADTVYNGWISAYVVNPGGNTYFVNSLTNRGEAYLWGEAYMIWGAEDAYYKNRGADRKILVSSLLTRFISHNGSSWSWDTWNDDIAWSVIACINGYQITNNPAFLNAATNNWSMAYNRGWDNVFDGGIWELMDDKDKTSGNKGGLSNWTMVIAACMIYQSTGVRSYLTKAEQIFAWARVNVFDPVGGRVYESVGYSGRGGDDNAYNSGLALNAANALYRLTGKIGYYNDATVAANHVIAKYGIMTEDHPANGDFGGEQFFRGLSFFASQNNLWPTYYQWLENNCTSAWNNRRTDYNITWNNFAALTTTNNLDGMETEGSVVVQAVTQLSPIAGIYVTTLTAKGTNGAITLNWNAPVGATNYNLWRANAAMGPYSVIAPGLVSNSFTDAAVSSCQNYYYAVTVTNTGVEGLPSAAVIGSLPGGALPAPWLNADVGAVGVAGSASYCNGQFTVAGSGGDIWNGADAFQYVYVYLPASTNCDIRARVASVPNTSGAAKAGLMIRASLAANSTHATVDLTPTSGAELLWRTSAGGTTTSINIAGRTAPHWIRLTRVNNLFTAYASPDGSVWSVIGTATNLVMTTDAYVGVAVCAHNNAVLNTSLIDNVSLNSLAPATPSGVQAFSGYGAVNLSWPPAANATSYVVSRSTSSGAETDIATTTTASYGDTGLVNGTTYYYVVRAQNATGASGESGEVSGVPIAPANGSYEAAVLANHPLGYWALNETNGSVAFDLVGGNNGAYFGGVALGQPGISFQAGGIPGAAFSSRGCSPLFNGSSGYVDIPQVGLNLTQAVTVIAWANLSVKPGNIAGLVGRGDSSWRMSVNTSGFATAGDGAAGNATGNYSIAASGWHMVAYTYTGNSGVINNGSLYLDGVLAANNTVTTPAGNGNDLWLAGAPDYGNGRLFFGNLAQVAVFTNALSGNQLQSLYKVAKSPDPVGLVAQGGYGRNSLNWSAIPGAINYQVARSTSSGGETFIGNTANAAYQDTAVVGGTNYYYVITPQSVNGLMSRSVEATAAPLAMPATNSYIAALLAAQAMACWELNETGNPASGTLTAYDYVGAFNGTYGNLAKNGNGL